MLSLCVLCNNGTPANKGTTTVCANYWDVRELVDLKGHWVFAKGFVRGQQQFRVVRVLLLYIHGGHDLRRTEQDLLQNG